MLIAVRFLWLVLAFGVGMTAGERVFVDTDCGEFGDDGVALVLLARSPDQVKLVGVSGVSGNVWAEEAAGFARRALAAAGCTKVNVVPGAALPWVRSAGMVEREAELWGGSGYHGAFDRKRPAGRDGMEGIGALIEAIDHNPGELTVLALGPMTNLATVFRIRPDLAKKIRRLVFMGGNVDAPGNVTKAAEFNFWFDPEAAAVVLRSEVPEKVMFALDITNKAPLARALFDRVVAVRTPVTELYRQDFGERYPGFLRDPKATGYLWDELAAAWLVDPGFVTREERRYLDVVTEFGPRYGAVVALDRRLAEEATPVRVMLDLDLARVARLYVEKLTAR